ncbi:hypothetical protein QPK13_08640 [Photorhabdus tasmaniensis]|uniref:hypothetical protein n=1 Tax=Photorhabdus sp. RM323S TaxID=3342828 RepID=UPI0036DE87AD
MERLLSHVDQLLNRAAVIDSMLFKSGALRRLSQRQVTLLNVMMDMPDNRL